MRLSGKAIAACALLSFSPLSFAAVYVGGSGMFSNYSKYDDVKSGFGGSGFLGYRPEGIPLVFEASYFTTGKNEVDDIDVDLSFTGTAVSVGYYGKFDRNGSGFFGKAGYYNGKSKLGGTGFSNRESSYGALVSVGVDWMLTPYFGFRGDVGSMFGVRDRPGIDSGHKSNITTANVGIVFAFGGSPAAPAAVAPPPAPVAAPQPPVYQPVPPPPPPPPPVAPAPLPPPAPVAAPMPEPAPAPVATPAKATGTAQLVPGAVLRSGPTMKSAGIRNLREGGTVKLFKRESNAEGPWWLVQLEDGTTGWMIEWGLARISRK